MAGVEASGHVAVVEDALHVGRGLDHGLHVRVQDLAQARVLADGVDLAEHPQEVGVLVAVERARDRPVVVHDGARDEGRGAGAAEELGHRPVWARVLEPSAHAGTGSGAQAVASGRPPPPGRAG